MLKAGRPAVGRGRDYQEDKDLRNIKLSFAKRHFLSPAGPLVYLLLPSLLLLILLISDSNHLRLFGSIDGIHADFVENLEITFPDDAGVIDVKRDYGATGNGITDDTQAIQNAIRENIGQHKIIYFPNGTYLVSDTLEWRDSNGTWKPYLTLQGQNRDKTIIKLKTSTPGYADPETNVSRSSPVTAVPILGAGLSLNQLSGFPVFRLFRKFGDIFKNI